MASRAGIRKDIPILFEIALSSLEQPVELFLGFGKLPERALREPRRIRDLAKATGHWAKTNVLDAEVLARFAEVIRPHPRPPADGGTAQLRELTFRRQPLIKMTTAERNRLREVSEGGRTGGGDAGELHKEAPCDPKNVVIRGGRS